ncbi:hypothetical protein EKO27_g856 [Xylaria grammica]|uniref:HD domain-containing protein n=1 Tax=Xylaria grammica TaxID=363999 RepID=A0A439DIM1_9PEZI|nr:hypothetical protein F5X98DRAFT_364274 [Xylaria grammica]RWA14260.1 hypothetical protein EKO27_g856 [Xylaria grammica]GAW19114.1 hypothetical protein ANO14919_085980 [Xylariales sp. No.14919]
MKFQTLISSLAVATAATCGRIPSKSCSGSSTGAALPTTKLANIEVVNTQLVQDALELIEVLKPIQPYLYNHLVRSWLYGAAAFNNNETLKASIDLEAHAIGTLLHDLGWDMRENSPWHSSDRPFEVDSALGAVEFIKEHNLSDWDATRLEKVYDGITLQGMGTYLAGKNIDSVWMVQSVEFEFPGPRDPRIRDEDYDSIQAEYPNDTVFRGTNETFTWLAISKPDGTRNTFVDYFGTAYVPGYGEQGHLAFDLITAGVADEIKNYPNSTFQSNL